MIGSNAPTIFDVLQAHPPKVFLVASSFPSANGECRGWGMEAGLQHTYGIEFVVAGATCRLIPSVAESQ